MTPGSMKKCCDNVRYERLTLAALPPKGGM